MSNVLIGIIGVILFIGLALAGALFLGPRFQESSNSSKAAAVMQSVAQVAQATNLYQLQEGRPLMGDQYATTMQTLVDAKYLKTTVRNPLNSEPIYLGDRNGYGRAEPVHNIQTTVGSGNDGVAKSICREIERQSGASNSEASLTPITQESGWGTRMGSGRQGCFLYAVATPGIFIAYAPL